MLPAIFIGHGSPMNAIDDNEFTHAWKEIAKEIPRPAAILAISAHWETKGTQVTAMFEPQTIHDFYGFPEILFHEVYPASGSPGLASQIKQLAKSTQVSSDLFTWGLDHGTWAVLRQMYPAADIPVVQLSLDRFKNANDHLALAKDLKVLREKNVLILCSGNIVHNLPRLLWTENGFSDEKYPWAQEFEEWVKMCLRENRIDELLDYRSLGEIAELSVRSAEHFLPLIYLAGCKNDNESFSFRCERIIGGSLSMTSVVLTQ